MMIAYMLEFLDLRIKPDWIMQKTMYEDQVGKTKGAILDFMGLPICAERLLYGLLHQHGYGYHMKHEVLHRFL